jgi:flagellar hook-basal body complex protein FliE
LARFLLYSIGPPPFDPDLARWRQDIGNSAGIAVLNGRARFYNVKILPHGRELCMIERADINSLLSQMRTIRTEIQQGPRPLERPDLKAESVGAPGISKTESNSFATLLKGAVDKVNEQQLEASRLSNAYERGDPNVDLPQVMIQAQKASVSFQAMTQVRNRLVTAYEDIMKMPI